MRAGLSNLPSFVRRLAPDLGLDNIELGDPAQRLSGQRSCARRLQVVKFASRVRPAGRSTDRAVVEQGVETGVGICLQYAFDLAKWVCGWMPLRSGV